MTGLKTYFYVSGILMSGIGFVRYLVAVGNLPVDHNPKKLFSRLLFAVTSGWILNIATLGGMLALAPVFQKATPSSGSSPSSRLL